MKEDDLEIYEEEENCIHPSADKIDGKWVCGVCECELDENMNQIHEDVTIEIPIVRILKYKG